MVCLIPTTPTSENKESRVVCDLEDKDGKKLKVKETIDSWKFEHDVAKESGIVLEFVSDENSMDKPFIIIFRGQDIGCITDAVNKAKIEFIFSREGKTGSVVVQFGGRVSLSSGTQVSSGAQAMSSSFQPANAGVPQAERCSNLAGGIWIPVPGDPVYGTGNFCVMKYPASKVNSVPNSQAGSMPWTKISKTDAISACKSIGQGYYLMSNPEWMTIAANAANQGANWSGGSVGKGMLSRGHIDNSAMACPSDVDDARSYADGSSCTNNTGDFNKKRTKTLSNGYVIWDIGGNVWNWTTYYNSDDKPGPLGNSWNEYPDVTGSSTAPKSHLVPLAGVQTWWSDSWTSAQGIGAFNPGNNGSAPKLARGGSFVDGSVSGAFAALFLEDASLTEHIGFRCVFRP
ncbi:MAG: SUMF1/EgtB/PvdO family nonheme iron enzyme [Oligoflexales bacterium]|nr:SUMF1/EgtB/PvdO family nonheme iron enzyme [Oligoflexales bacterium]